MVVANLISQQARFETRSFVSLKIVAQGLTFISPITGIQAFQVNVGVKLHPNQMKDFKKANARNNDRHRRIFYSCLKAAELECFPKFPIFGSDESVNVQRPCGYTYRRDYLTNCRFANARPSINSQN